MTSTASSRATAPGHLRALAVLAAALLLAGFAHGLELSLSGDDGPRIVTARYAAGSPAADADVVVTAPMAGAGSADAVAWQTGRTDPMGRFAFVPDRPGEWRVSVDDGQGHRAEVTFVVGAEAEAEIEVSDQSSPHTHDDAVAGESEGEQPVGAALPRGGERFWQLATGLALIAALTGVAYGATARR